MSIAFARLGRLVCLPAMKPRLMQTALVHMPQTSFFGALAQRVGSFEQSAQIQSNEQPIAQQAILHTVKRKKNALRKRRKRRGDRQITCRHR